MKKSIVFVSLALLAACGGGGSVPTVPTAGPTTTPVPVHTSTPTPSPQPSATLQPFTAVHATFATTPTALAVQIGTGSWKAVTPAPSVEIDLPKSTTMYGIAYVCPSVSAGANQEYILQATTTDATTVPAACPSATPAPPATATITGSFDLTAVPGATGVEVYTGASSYRTNSLLGTYNVLAPVGNHDIVALALNGFDVVGASVLRNQAIANNAVINIPAMVPGDAATTEPVTLPSTASGFIPDMTVHFVTSGGTAVVISDPSFINSYGAIPASQVSSGDSYDMTYQASRVSIGLDTINVEQRFTTAAPITITAPSAPQFYAPTPAAYPTFTFDNASLLTGGNIYDSVDENWGGSSGQYALSTYVSSSWLQGVNHYTIPKLDSIPGFFAAAASGSAVNWLTGAHIVSAPIFNVIESSALPLGVTHQWLQARSQFIEP